MTSVNPVMRIAGLDYALADDRLTLIEYNSDDSLLGFDLIIWAAPQSDPESEEVLHRRRKELSEHLDAGRPLVLMVPPPKETSVYSPTMVEPRSLLEMLPFQLSTRTARGRNFALAAGEPFSALWEVLENIATHQAVIDSPVGETLLRIAKTPAVVGSLAQVGGAPVLLIPELSDEFSYDDEQRRSDGQLQSHMDVVNALLDFFAGVRTDGDLPDWTEHYLVPGEEDVLRAINRDRDSIRRAQVRIERREGSLRRLRQRKRLIAASGTPLEMVVEEAFRALGCEVEPGPEGGTDRIVRFGRRVAVVEVKGPSKSAKEADAAQLSKWVAQFRADHRRTPKGILVANAWHKRPLKERTQRPFPSQMLRYAADQQGYCLITSTQLLGAWLAAEENPEKQDAIVSRIFRHRGVFPDFDDWADFLDLRDGEET